MIIYPVDKAHLISLEGSLKITMYPNDSGYFNKLDTDWNGHFRCKRTE
jgi:hypothetical protein